MRFVFGPCFENTILGVLSSLAIIKAHRERERGWLPFTLIVTMLSCGCFSSVSLPRGILGRFVICDCVFSEFAMRYLHI